MSSFEREGSRDRDSHVLRHQHSFSDSGRFSVPMWDSSDPDRAPPPLPLNPSSPVLSTRSNASANIQAAAKAIQERARDSANAYTSSAMSSSSPEKSLIKGAQHRRMQSVQGGAVRDLRTYLDGMRSGSPERPISRASGADQDVFSSPERSASHVSTPTPASRDPLKDTPSLKPTARPPPRPILGENSPPSSTMLALQAMAARDSEAPFQDITNGQRGPQNVDNLSSQLTNITNIATSLQREMAQLSRRSKDNAADLISLKEATKTRDEDIRKNLRDLVTSPLLGASPTLARATGNFGLGLLDSKSYTSPPPVPRSASHNSFLEERLGSASPYSVEGAASVAMLEKIIREMVTKEGQNRLLSTCSELMEKATNKNDETAKKVGELAEFIKDTSQSQALVRSTHTGPSRLDLNFDSPDSLARSMSEQNAKNDSLNADVLKLLQKLKESVLSNGGLTAEVKAMTRELRGEVLGMGRELGRKLDQVSEPADDSRSLESHVETRSAIERIISEGLSDLRAQMMNVIQESRRQSSSALEKTRDNVDSQDVYAIVKHALSEHSTALVQSSQAAGVDKDSILQAVREAYEDYKPEIELQQFGLERDEILQVLKEGLDDYQTSRGQPQTSAASKEEIYQTMQQALQTFEPPRPAIDMVEMKDEILASVRACLEDFMPSNQPNIAGDVTREALLSAVREGFAAHGPSAPHEFEISREDLFDAVKASLDGSTIPFGGFGEEILLQLRELIEGMRVEFKQYSAANGRDTEQVLDAVKDGLESLRSNVELYVDRAQDVTGKDEIVDVVRTGLDQLRIDVQGYCADGPTTGRDEMIDYIKAEFEHLHASIGSQSIGRSMNDGEPSGRSEEVLIAVTAELTLLKEMVAASLAGSGGVPENHDILNAVREAVSSSPSAAAIPPEMLEALRGEFENLRQTGGSRADTDEVVEAVRLGLDDLRSHFERKLDNPERQMTFNSELLDAMHEGLDSLRSDVTKSLERPVDMTVSYDILETLKEGLGSLRADMDKLLSGSPISTLPLENGEIVLADALPDAVEGAREVPAAAAAKEASPTSDALKRSDLERMEALLAQLQIKVEGLNANIQDMPGTQTTQSDVASAIPGAALKEDLIGMEESIKEIQVAILALAAKEKVESENGVSKQDTDAIETLLRNTKAHLEEALPGPDNAVTKDHLDAVEVVVRGTGDAVQDLAAKLDELTASKQDVAVVEVLVQDLKSALDELKNSMPNSADESNDKSLTKTDLDILGVIVTEIKMKITEMDLPDPATLPSRADIEQIVGLVQDLRASQDKGKEDYERDLAVTAKAFDDRKRESEEFAAHMAGLKTVLKEVQADVLDKVIGGESGLDVLGERLSSLQDKIDDHSPVAADVQTLFDIVKLELERAHDSLEDMKIDHAKSTIDVLEKHVEHKDLIIAQVTEKVDTCFDGMMAKYNEAQLAAEENAHAMESKASQQEELLANTKDMADELKISIDTLGTALTASTAAFSETADKLDGDSKTLFNRVDDTYNKLDETQTGLKAEHQATRDEIAKTLDGISDLQGDFTEYHPRFMMSLKEIHALVSQHYEHSQKAAMASKERSEELKTNLSTGLSGLPELMPVTSASTESSDIGVNSAVHEKLDRLVDNATQAGSATAQLERLDQIHQQVMATAAEVTAFVTVQTRQIGEGHGQEADDVARLIERRLAQKDQCEAEITSLNHDKDTLRATVEGLRAERDALAAQKLRLTADVSSLNTALAIRREELHAMDNKADALERRILDGLIDHSRAALLTKSSKPISPKKIRGRDLRIPSNASAATVVSSTPSALPLQVLALKASRPSSMRNSYAAPNTAERRIMSLSQISRNIVPAGASRESLVAVATAPRSPATASIGALGRSQSVRNPRAALRKSSWGGRRTSVFNKENESVVSEEDEEDELAGLGDENASVVSGSRTSYTASISDLSRTDSIGGDGGRRTTMGSYSEGVTPGISDDGRMPFSVSTRSVSGSGSVDTVDTGTASTGSYLTGSELDRRTSLGSTVAGTVDGQRGGQRQQHDDDDDDDEERYGGSDGETVRSSSTRGGGDSLAGSVVDGANGVYLVSWNAGAAAGQKQPLVSVAPASDSGLGSELPTAAMLSGSEADGYFERA